MKRNLSSIMKLDEIIDTSYRRTKEAKEAKMDHGAGVAAETELTVVVPDNANELHENAVAPPPALGNQMAPTTPGDNDAAAEDVGVNTLNRLMALFLISTSRNTRSCGSFFVCWHFPLISTCSLTCIKFLASTLSKLGTGAH